MEVQQATFYHGVGPRNAIKIGGERLFKALPRPINFELSVRNPELSGALLALSFSREDESRLFGVFSIVTRYSKQLAENAFIQFPPGTLPEEITKIICEIGFQAQKRDRLFAPDLLLKRGFQRVTVQLPGIIKEDVTTALVTGTIGSMEFLWGEKPGTEEKELVGRLILHPSNEPV